VGRPRIAVVGTGAWGLSHVRTFAAEATAQLTWICDREPAALARAARLAPHARAAASLDDVLAARDVDGVVIATPAVTHAELAVACLARGLHVLVEKPLAMSTGEAERIAEAAAKSGATVLVGHLMRYHPVVEHLRRLVAGGELGEVFYLSSVRANLGRLRRDENALWSFGPHDLSMIDYLVPGTPVTVAARGASFLQPGIADVVFVNLELAPPLPGARRVMAQIHLSWLNPHKERRLMIVGSRKMAELDDTAAEKLRIYDRGYDRPPEFSNFAEYLTIRNGDIFVPQVPMAEPLAVMARHFAACVAGEESPRTDLASGLRVVRLLAAAQASLERGGEPVSC
jgi:predicted dehydrogenase